MFDTKLKSLTYEINLSASNKIPLATEIIKNVLTVSGISPARITEQSKNQRLIVSAYVETKKEAEQLSCKLKAWHLKGVRMNLKVLPKKFWLERWKKDWHPFKLTKKIDVVPVWQKQKYRIGRRKFILLDTITAFGTGLHETTKFMSQFIEDLDGQFETFLDIGTGSGLLTSVALHSGAKKVFAIDISPISTKTAKENLKVNNQKFNQIKAVDLMKFKCNEKFDLVAANLITHDLIDMKSKIFSLVKNGKWLAVSGISLDNLSKLRMEYQVLPLKLIKAVQGKKWAALLYRKEG